MQFLAKIFRAYPLEISTNQEELKDIDRDTLTEYANELKGDEMRKLETIKEILLEM